MSDKETKGAYLPFRTFLEHSIRHAVNTAYECWNTNSDSKASYWSSLAKERDVSLKHYDELLRLHNLQEVK